MNKENKSKIGKIISTILIVLIIAYVVLTYPFFVKVKDGETICEDILGIERSCH